VSEAEEDMLEYALFRTDASRLSCQLRVTKELGEWCKTGSGVIKLPKY
jgi:ferredoxin